MPASPFEIVGIGEILWDLLPSGKKLGGAPANFTYHAHALGASSRLVSRVGDDELGREILRCWREIDIPAETIQVDSSTPTGMVSVKLSPDGQPHYTIHEDVAWDRLEATATALEAVERADAVCFGSLAQRTLAMRECLAALLKAARPDALRIFDVNLRAPFDSAEVIESSLKSANVLKLNEHELPVLARMFGIDGNPAQQLAAIAERFSLRVAALTRGGAGSLIYRRGASSEHLGVSATVQDTVGAGDAFTAALAVGLLHGWPLELINDRANQVAAFVCSQPGGMPPIPEAIRELFRDPEGSEPNSAPGR